MTMFVIGVLAAAMIATVVAVVAFLFSQATTAGYSMDASGEVQAPAAELEAVADRDPAGDDSPPMAVRLVDGTAAAPAPRILVAEGEMPDGLPFLVLPANDYSIGELNDDLRDEFRVVEPVAGRYRATEARSFVLEARATARMASGDVEVSGITVHVEPGDRRDASETVHAEDVAVQVADILADVLSSNPRLSPASAATRRRVAARYGERDGTPSSSARITLETYRATRVAVEAAA